MNCHHLSTFLNPFSFASPVSFEPQYYPILGALLSHWLRAVETPVYLRHPGGGRNWRHHQVGREKGDQIVRNQFYYTFSIHLIQFFFETVILIGHYWGRCGLTRSICTSYVSYTCKRLLVILGIFLRRRGGRLEQNIYMTIKNNVWKNNSASYNILREAEYFGQWFSSTNRYFKI